MGNEEKHSRSRKSWFVASTLSAATVALAAVGYATIARLEVYPGNPTLGVIYKFAEALDMDPRDLLPDSGKRPAKGRKSRQGQRR